MNGGKQLEIAAKVTGDQEASAAIRKLHADLGLMISTEAELAGKRAGFMSAAEAETAEVNRLAEAGKRRAEESRKVIPAVEAEVVTLKKLEEELAAATLAYKTAAVGSDEFAAASKRLETAKVNLSGATRTVTTRSLDMRSTMQNVGYQVQDMAVQIGMGTSALRAFSQQGPQLLSGFGPWGLLAGTIIALGAPLAAAFMAPGEAAEKSKDKVADLADLMDDYAESAAKAARQRDVDALGEWFDALDDEAEKLERNADVLERSIELQSKLNTLKRGVESARRDLDIARIESDPNLTEAEKTRQVAAYKEREERRKAEGKIDAVKNDATSAERGYGAAQEQKDSLAKAAEEAKARREAIEAEQAAAQERTRIAKDEVPKLEQKLRDAEEGQRAARVGAQGNVGAETEAAWRKQNSEIRAQIEAAKAAAGGDLSDEERKKKSDDDKAALNEARSKENEIAGKLEAAAKAAEAAYAKMVNARAFADQAAPMIEREYRTQAEARSVRTESKASDQEAAAAKKAEDERKKQAEEEEQRKARERSEAITMAALGMDASDAAGGKGGNARVAAAIKRKAESVMANPTKQGADEMASLVERLLEWAERQGGGGESKYKALEQRLKTLEARQKNGRDGK